MKYKSKKYRYGKKSNRRYGKSIGKRNRRTYRVAKRAAKRVISKLHERQTIFYEWSNEPVNAGFTGYGWTQMDPWLNRKVNANSPRWIRAGPYLSTFGSPAAPDNWQLPFGLGGPMNFMEGNSCTRVNLKLKFDLYFTIYSGGAPPFTQETANTPTTAQFIQAKIKFFLLTAAKGSTDAELQAYLATRSELDYSDPFVAGRVNVIKSREIISGREVGGTMRTFTMTLKKRKKLTCRANADGALVEQRPSAGQLYLYYESFSPSWLNNAIRYRVIPAFTVKHIVTYEDF